MQMEGGTCSVNIHLFTVSHSRPLNPRTKKIIKNDKFLLSDDVNFWQGHCEFGKAATLNFQLALDVVPPVDKSNVSAITSWHKALSIWLAHAGLQDAASYRTAFVWMLHSAVHPQQPAIKSRFHFVTYPARTKWILTQRLAKNIKLRMFNNSLVVPSNLDKQLSVDSQYFSDANPTICPLTHFHLKWYSTKIPHSETYLRQEFRKPAVYCWTLERWCFFSLLSSGIFIFSEYHSCCCKKKKLPYLIFTKKNMNM